MSISRNDLDRLIQEPSADVRAYITAKISDSFSRDFYTEREMQLASDIFRLLLKDTAQQVRKTMAAHLRSNPRIPYDVAVALAHDEPNVAEEILEHCALLTEDDLIHIIESTRNVQKWQAIAKREHISAPLSSALIATRSNPTVHTLLQNKGAEIHDAQAQEIVAIFGTDTDLIESLVVRGGLSAAFAERLYTLQSERLKRHLTKKHRLNWKLAKETSDTAREAAILNFLTPWMPQTELAQLVKQMHSNGRLNYSIILRSLCCGEIRFFETAMATYANITIENARTLMQDQGELGFRALYDSAHMPEGFRDAAHYLYHTSVSILQQNTLNKDMFASQMLDAICKDAVHSNIENIHYFVKLLKQQVQGEHASH